jgi:hypothetical protein
MNITVDVKQHKSIYYYTNCFNYIIYKVTDDIPMKKIKQKTTIK